MENGLHKSYQSLYLAAVLMLKGFAERYSGCIDALTTDITFPWAD